MKIAILGSGPAGLMAAAAVSEMGDSPFIFSERLRPSHLNGAQYLHSPIPGVDPGDSVRVRYRLQGSSVDYRMKVYGPSWDGTVSPDDLEEEHEAWDIRHTYSELWDRFGRGAIEATVIPASIPGLSSDFHKIISAIPRPVLCAAKHSFQATQIVAAGEAPDLGVRLPYDCPENTVICNGEDSPSWYRLSNIFGHKTVEWPLPRDDRPIPVQGAAVVDKPLSHNCDCWPNVLHVGRYGAWKKGVLSHEAYEDTIDWYLESL